MKCCNGSKRSLADCFQDEAASAVQSMLPGRSRRRSTTPDVFEVTPECFASRNERYGTILQNNSCSPQLGDITEEGTYFHASDLVDALDSLALELQNHAVEFSRIRHLQMRQPLAWFPLLGSIVESNDEELITDEEESIFFIKKVKSAPRLFDRSRHLSMRQPHAWFTMLELIPEKTENELSERIAAAMASRDCEGRKMEGYKLVEQDLISDLTHDHLQGATVGADIHAEFSNKLRAAPSACIHSQHAKVRQHLASIAVLERIGEELENYIAGLEPVLPKDSNVYQKVVPPKLKGNAKNVDCSEQEVEGKTRISKTAKHALKRLFKPPRKHDKQASHCEHLKNYTEVGSKSVRYRIKNQQIGDNSLSKQSSIKDGLNEHRKSTRQQWLTKHTPSNPCMKPDERVGGSGILTCSLRDHKKQSSKGYSKEQTLSACLPENHRSLDDKFLKNARVSNCKPSIADTECVKAPEEVLHRDSVNGKMEPGGIKGQCSQQSASLMPFPLQKIPEEPRHVALDREPTNAPAFILKVQHCEHAFVQDRYSKMRQPLAWKPQMEIISEEDEGEEHITLTGGTGKNKKTVDIMEPHFITEEEFEGSRERAVEICSLADILAIFDPYAKKIAEDKAFCDETKLTAVNYEETLLQASAKFETENIIENNNESNSEDPPKPRPTKAVSRLRAAFASSKRNTIRFLRQSANSFSHNPWRAL